MQNIDELYQFKNFWIWNKYIPEEKHYINFDSNVIAAFFKIEDLISMYSKARFSLNMLEAENYGQLIAKHDESHLKFIRSYFIQNALVYYNITIDMAWQVIFFYISDSTEYFLLNHEEYRIHSGRCNRTNLIELMKMYGEDKLKEVEDAFFNDEIVINLRKNYNAYKHKSSFHVNELGKQYEQFMIGISFAEDNVNLSMFTREEIDIDNLKEILINFDIKFFNYFSKVLQIITPPNFDEIMQHSIIDFNINSIFNYAKRIQSYKNNEYDRYKKLFDIAYYDKLGLKKR